MARRTITTHTCDMSGYEGEDVRTHTFALDGKMWEIDLSPDYAEELRLALVPFLEHARKHSGNGKPARQSGPDPKVVRAWALANGVPVSERGRIKAEVYAQYVERAA